YALRSGKHVLLPMHPASVTHFIVCWNAQNVPPSIAPVSAWQLAANAGNETTKSPIPKVRNAPRGGGLSSRIGRIVHGFAVATRGARSVAPCALPEVGELRGEARAIAHPAVRVKGPGRRLLARAGRLHREPPHGSVSRVWAGSRLA